MKPILKQLFNILLLSCLSFNVFAETVLIKGFVRAMPESVPNTAVYFTLENHGPAKRLIAAETSIAEQTQLHTMTHTDGMMRMRQVEYYELPAHQRLVLSESGNHIMLLGLKQSLKLGSKVDLLLKFDDNSQQKLSLPILKQDNNQSEPMSHHHH